MRRSQADARQARKMERATRHTFGSEQAGAQGQSIVEMLEERLFDAGRRYVRVQGKQIDYPSEVEWHTAKQTARGEMRGLAISVAMMRHPLRRYETAWWGYVKKLEKRAVTKARSTRVDQG